MFSVKLVARPDARMVEVPLEIEAELPREFEGAALLASSGLPRKVKIKAQKDALKLSTAYRTDELLGDIVKGALRGSAQDVQRVKDATVKFIRTVRERRQDGATLLVSSNGRGRIDVAEQLPAVRAPHPGGASAAPAAAALAEPARPAATGHALADRISALERRLGELEGAFAKTAEGADRLAQLEQRVGNLASQVSRAVVASEVAGPGMDKPAAQVIQRTPGGGRRNTAVEAYAEGLRNELRARASGDLASAKSETERCDRAAALAVEAEQMLGAPREGVSERLREASALAAARLTALSRVADEIEFYETAEMPVAAQLLAKLGDGPGVPDPAAVLEPVAQGVVRAARGGDCKPRTAWLKRAAVLCHWTLVEPEPGSAVDHEWHQEIDSGGGTVVRLASPGLRRADGSGIVRARVHVDPEAARLPEEPDEPAAVPEPLSVPPPSEPSQELAPSAPPPADIVVSDEADDSDEEEVVELPASAAIEESAGPVPLPPPTAETVAPSEPPPPAPAFNAPFGDLAGDDSIRPDEAEAAASAASRIPRVVHDDPSRLDEALAAEVAMAVQTEVGADAEWSQVARGPAAFAARPAGPDEEPEEVSDSDVEEVVEEPIDEKKD